MLSMTIILNCLHILVDFRSLLREIPDVLPAASVLTLRACSALNKKYLADLAIGES
jgi:hypothetical protein